MRQAQLGQQPERQVPQVLLEARRQAQRLVPAFQRLVRPQGPQQQELRLLGQALRPLALASLGQQEQLNHLLSR